MKDKVWLVKPDTKELVTPYELHEGSERILAAQPFTVSMVTVVVAEDLDGIFRGKNDILVLTKSSMGEQPLVERIHFFEEEVPKGHPIQHMLADNVFVTDDYNEIDKLWLELSVVEVDTDTGERKAALKAFQGLATTAGAIFPAMLPYAFGASATMGVIKKLVKAFEKDKHVVKVPFALYPGDPRPGKPPLQKGTYVCFAQPQDPSGLKFHMSGLLSSGDVPSEVSYTVFDIAPVKQLSPKFLISQKVAILLTQMEKGNQNSAISTIEFLSDTLSQYDNFKKLNRYLELKGKQNPTAEEETLMSEIKNVEILKPFLLKD
jgi:hypothetical protein